LISSKHEIILEWKRSPSFFERGYLNRNKGLNNWGMVSGSRSLRSLPGKINNSSSRDNEN
jgi:hypothetical protein